MPDSLPYTPALEGRTLLDELNHRIKNELASVINLVTFKAVWTDNVDAKEELSNVVDLLHQHVQVHSILTMPDGDTLVDAGEQLRKLGLAMSRSKLDRMNIRLVLSAEILPLESERCWRLALAIYELVTNAVRHACFDGRDGEIKIEPDACGLLGELPSHRQRIGRGKNQARSRPADRRRSGHEPGRPDRPHLRPDTELVRPGLSSDTARAARQPRDCRPPPQNRSPSEDRAAALRALGERASDGRSPSDQNSRSKDIHHVEKDSSNAVRNRDGRRRTRHAKCRARPVWSSSWSATSLRWSSSRFRSRWPASGAGRRWSSVLVVLRT